MALILTVLLAVPVRAGRVFQPTAAKPSRQPFKAVAAVQQSPREWRLAAAVCHIWQQRPQAQQPVLEVAKEEQQQSVIQQLKQQCSALAVVAPFASTTIVQASSSTQAEVYYGLAKAIDIYLAILTVRVLLSWFRNIDWFGEPWNTLRQLTDPFLQVFRGIIPPLGGIDLSPMLGFFLLNFLRNLLMNWAMHNAIAKGDVLTVAQIAGIQGAKQTSTLIPLCHNIFLSKADVQLELLEGQQAVGITAIAKTVGQTGVEMEALTAAAVAALTVYDMCKAVSKDIVITNLQLEHKEGGKGGMWQRSQD
eukprot:gene13852-13974_t